MNLLLLSWKSKQDLQDLQDLLDKSSSLRNFPQHRVAQQNLQSQQHHRRHQEIGRELLVVNRCDNLKLRLFKPINSA